MLASGHVPHVNGYAFTDAARPWVMHEWLYGVLLASGADRLGPAFFALAGVLFGTLTAALAIAFTVGHARRLAAAALSLLVLAPIAASFYGPRPSFASLALALAMMHVAFTPHWSRARGASAVALEWVWTQLHGSFPLGIVILLAATAEHARDRTRGSRAWTTIGAALVTLLNPYGLRLHGLVGHYLTGDDEAGHMIHETIEEFQPLWRAGPVWASPPAILALGAVVALAVSALAHRRHMVRGAFVIVLAAMAIAQARHAAPAIVIGSALLVVEIDDLVDGAALPAIAPARAWSLVAMILAPGLLASTALWARAQRSRSAGAWIDDSLGGASVLTFARSLPDGARVYAPFAPSAVVLWGAAPRGVRVFFDPRNDCYSADVFRASAAVATDAHADRLLVERGTDWAIVPETTRTFGALARSPLWARVASDDGWSLFQSAAR
jgi:hypothetical protein